MLISIIALILVISFICVIGYCIVWSIDHGIYLADLQAKLEDEKDN